MEGSFAVALQHLQRREPSMGSFTARAPVPKVGSHAEPSACASPK